MNNNKETLALLGSLSSKICHDIVAPVSAVDMGLSLLEENLPPSIKQDPSYTLLKDSVQKTLNRINFFRYAFAFGKTESPPKREEFEEHCKNACKHNNLNFNITHFNLAPDESILKLRVIACILYITLDCLPKGGYIDFALSPTTIGFNLSGKRLIVGNTLDKIISKNETEADGKTQNILPLLIIKCLAYLNLSLSMKQTTENSLTLTIKSL